ncbi:DUF1810 domain-containing protein [Stutzerimonas zhaodongensis]|jgi:uncharacterized protein (DUF1810 family)|uniref:DUF1810 domain-containing protein n=1 Tax=Stutzerimonas zhaodongensis TaxID=1176257 RepID=A0A365PZF5_9GAMM|nr:DUF1810 domain-containing protein [Stutzerimonas zhaodongensis]QWV15250.1 DUF1810 domain-containing protein [Stutzerimonas zhaodongensis]RBA62317.1 DUF1810 domain-containing protein [Stutzerimonas zhaodongensis]
MSDPHDLQRFVDAQQSIYDRALAELNAGHKQSHWMWFIFPQIAGLGHSDMARRYAIKDADEAAAYLEHPLLGPRLEQCAQALLAHAERPARQILGSPDDMKLRSSMTLFAAVAPERPTFQAVLDAFFAADPDPATLSRLDR